MLFFLVPIEDIPVVIVIVIINSFLYEYLRTASISLLREDDRRYISAARFSGVVQNALRFKAKRERERERKNTRVKDMKTCEISFFPRVFPCQSEHNERRTDVFSRCCDCCDSVGSGSEDASAEKTERGRE
jgi:hypothetical protein